ncbi:hypothetical protein VTK73DRAFT_3428 [Phialemonium thermophilum]|uniref:Uncharacterized protein n=1 Tax=Phialemonium thermophilum TaxID=223376 RepID=A0ABR3WZ74_9PEZI
MGLSSPSNLTEKAQLQQHYERTQSIQQDELEASPTTAGAHLPSRVLSQEDLEHSPAGDADVANAVPMPPPYSGPSRSTIVSNAAAAASSSSSASAGATAHAAVDPVTGRGAALPSQPQRYPGLPVIDYRLYSPPLFELSSDRTTLKSSAPYLSSSAAALAALIRAQATVPPKQQIHITGRRRGPGSGTSGGKIDFDVRLNLMPLLVPEDPRDRMDYLTCVADDELALRGGPKPTTAADASSTLPSPRSAGKGDAGLEEWARRFVEDPGQVKSFALERVVINLDTEWLEGQLRSMVASTGYQGAVSVTFPVTHARVVVHSPDRVNRFFTTVTAFFAGRRKYEVVRAVWPFATHRNGERGRRCAVQSEATWWREWRDPIKYAIVSRRQGWVTNEDKLEALMEGVGKGVTTIDWGPGF